MEQSILSGLRDPSTPDAADDGLDDASTRWQLSDDVVIESAAGGRVTLMHRVTAARLMVGASVHRFLLAFEQPRRIDEVLPAGVPDALRPQLRLLVARGYLRDADARIARPMARTRVPVAYRFCNAPALATGVSAEIVALGVPYDLAGDLDCREAPALLRRRSHDHAYEISVADGRPRGWFDANRAVRILDGVRIADGGDIPVTYGESQSDLFEKVAAALDEVRDAGAIPLVLGGDPSTTCAVARHLSRREPLMVMQCSPRVPVRGREGAVGVEAGAIARRLAGHAGIEAFVALGDVDEADIALPAGVVRIAADALRDDEAGHWIDRIGHGHAVHLSIDLALACPAYLRADANGRAHGLTLDALRRLLLRIGATQRIVGIDLVGLDARADGAEIAATIGCQLALTAMHAARGSTGGDA